MKLDVPFFKQDTLYTCGPAVVQMILRYYGIVASEHTLREKMKTNSDVGTMHKYMIDEIRAAGLYCYVNNHSSVQEIAFFLKIGLPVIVHYMEPSENSQDHYAVVVGIEDHHIILNDPWHGKDFSLTLTDFEHRWHDGKGIYHNWLLTASKEHFGVGRQYAPAA